MNNVINEISRDILRDPGLRKSVAGLIRKNLIPGLLCISRAV